MHSYSSSSSEAFSNAYSHCARITETGVRSSWEASEVNCRSAWKLVSSRSNIRLNVCASCPSSSRDATWIRRLKSPLSATSSAVLRIARIGRSERLASRYPPTAARKMNTGSMISTAVLRTATLMVLPDTGITLRIHRSGSDGNVILRSNR